MVSDAICTEKKLMKNLLKYIKDKRSYEEKKEIVNHRIPSIQESLRLYTDSSGCVISCVMIQHVHETFVNVI